MSLPLQLPDALGSILTHLTTLSTPVLWLRLPMTLCRLLLCSVIKTKSASHRWCGKLFPGHHRTFGIIQNRVILFSYFFFHLLRLFPRMWSLPTLADVTLPHAIPSGQGGNEWSVFEEGPSLLLLDVRPVCSDVNTRTEGWWVISLFWDWRQNKASIRRAVDTVERMS